VGKTHILHAIGSALKKNWDENAVLLTSGVHLATAASAALASGQFAKIEERLASAKALLVDDVHLLVVAEANQASLAKIFQLFLKNNLQIVLTSVYSPRALGGLEEALKISLSTGWAVDMKVPNSSVQEEVVNAFVERGGSLIVTADVKKLLEKLGPLYCEFPDIVQRWTALGEVYRAQGKTPVADDVLSDIMNPGTKVSPSDVPTDAELAGAKSFQPPGPGPHARNLAIFCPKGQDAMLPWLVARFFQTAAQFSISRTYQLVLCEAYDTEQPFGAPFQMGESCRRVGAQAALVLGPAADSKLAGRGAEFSHAVRHILEALDVAAAWIPFTETTTTRPFLAAHLDFLCAARPL
jgi:hypothetical protein